MSTTPATAPTPEPTAAPKKGSKSKLFVIVGGVAVVLLGGGGAAFWMMRKPAEAKAVEAPKKKPDANGIVTFEPFVVNLADPGAQHFLRINVRLVVGEAEEAEKIQKSEVQLMRLRSDILELLTTETSEHIVTPEGKTELKKKINERAHHIVEPTEVADVLFSDFVVQY
jgi:flagellar FliL protein